MSTTPRAGQGESPVRLVIAGALIVLATAGFALRRPIVSVVAAAGAGLLAATRLEVYEHELLAGWLPGSGQRVAIGVAVALSLGVVASALVGALGPSKSEVLV